jgi:hypothetical protein
MSSNLPIVLVQDEKPKEMSFDGFRVYVSQQSHVEESTKKMVHIWVVQSIWNG